MYWFGEKVYLADHVLHLSVSPALLSKILGSENVYCETVWLADIGLAKTFFLSIIPRLGQSNDGIFFFTLLATHDFSFRLVYVSTYYSIKVQGFVRKKKCKYDLAFLCLSLLRSSEFTKA